MKIAKDLGNLPGNICTPSYLAKQAKVPIIPIGLSGLFHLKSKDSWVIRPRPITIRFGKPVSPEEIEKLSKEDLNIHIYNQISALINKD